MHVTERNPDRWMPLRRMPLLRRRLLALLPTLLLVPVLAWSQVSDRVKTDEVQAQLVAHAPDGVAAGKPSAVSDSACASTCACVRASTDFGV